MKPKELNQLIGAIASGNVVAMGNGIIDHYAIWIVNGETCHKQGSTIEMSKQEVMNYAKRNNITCNIFLPDNNR